MLARSVDSNTVGPYFVPHCLEDAVLTFIIKRLFGLIIRVKSGNKEFKEFDESDLPRAVDRARRFCGLDCTFSIPYPSHVVPVRNSGEPSA